MKNLYIARRQNRKERILCYLDGLDDQTFAAPENHAARIAEELGIDRANASRELNRLAKEGAVIKVSGKPVLYYSKKALEDKYTIVLSHTQFSDKEELMRCLTNAPKPQISAARTEAQAPSRDPARQIFGAMIGADYSLKNPIKQAVAAIIYPPNGLHTFLIGPTGVGKTTFAELMYRYAIEIGRFRSDAPYIIFNCADYASNPQLLLSYLFGHVKGAFTGADKEKKGVVDAADGGVLFLDEVHRLPAEGQEMLFSLTDRGKFRRLGESATAHAANVFLILATTENPEKNILATFLRRIPCVIKLPGLAERPLQERLQLICAFFTEEAKKIKLPLTVTTEVLKLFLIYDCRGNIGQLKNDLQIVCANAFVECVAENKEQVYIRLSLMTDPFKNHMPELDKKREELAQNFDLHTLCDLTFHPEQNNWDDPLQKVLRHDEYRTAEDFYENILHASRKYFEEGKPLAEIKQNMNRQVESYFQQYTHAKRKTVSSEPQSLLYKIVKEDIVRVVKEILTEFAADLQIQIDPKIVYGLALHIETLSERIKNGVPLRTPQLPTDSAALADEYEMSQKIRGRLARALHIEIPEEEAAFIAMFLYALKTNRLQNYIGVLVLAHGDTTASSMADVANRLLDIDHVTSVDMPLAETIDEALEKAIRAVKKIDRGRGVLFLADMGSLTAFAEAVMKQTGIPCRTVKMVTTPTVIEAARKSMMPNLTLDVLAEEVENTSRFIGRNIPLPDACTPSPDENEECYDHFNFEHQKMMTLLKKVLAFLDADKAYNVLHRIYENLCARLSIVPDRGLKIKFMFHNMSMLERAIARRPLAYTQLKTLKENRRTVFSVVKKEFKYAENVFGTVIPDSEIAYIVEMLQIYLPS